MIAVAVSAEQVSKPVGRWRKGGEYAAATNVATRPCRATKAPTIIISVLWDVATRRDTTSVREAVGPAKADRGRWPRAAASSFGL